MRIVIIGANGQLGTDLTEVLSEDHEVSGLTHSDIAVEDLESCKTVLPELKPDVIINTAAFHKVALCESDPAKTFAVNSIGAKNIAAVCSDLGALDVYISTDFVFDGGKDGLYTESDSTNPLMTYGISKLAGESYTTNYCDKHYVVRIASVFGKAGASGKGGNFVETMINKAKAGDEIKVINDIFMTPTYTMSASRIINALIKKEAPYGVYHVTNQPQCTWFDFTKEIFELLSLEIDVKPISANNFKSATKTPKNSALTSNKLPSLGIQLESWKDGLREYLKEKKYL